MPRALAQIVGLYDIAASVISKKGLMGFKRGILTAPAWTIARARYPSVSTTFAPSCLETSSLLSFIAVFKSKEIPSSTLIRSTWYVLLGWDAYCRLSWFRDVIIIVPWSQAGKNCAKSSDGSSALSIIRSHFFLLHSHLLTDSMLSSWLHSRATLRKDCSAIAFVLASIQKMLW